MTDESQSMVARAPALALADHLTDEDLARIRLLGDGKTEPEQIFAFRMVATGDGLDYYFTRQHDTSLKNYVRDLKKGQSVLGSHDVGTFSYGSSFDAEIRRADATAPEYEASFYRQYAGKPELSTSKLVVGKYYLTRGITLNGQKTDDLITAMQTGAVRKASISFTVGRYICGIDNKNMLASFMGPWPDEVEGCTHFPGVEYKKEGVGWAWMADSDLMETSLVYKNASPSAMLIRYAENLAEKGMIPTTELVKLEQRLDVRLPTHERTHYPVAKLEERMKGTAADPAETTEEAVDPPVEKVETTETVTTVTTETVIEEPTTSNGTASNLTIKAQPDPAIARQLVEIETRDTAIAEELGEPISVEAVRKLKSSAALGEALFASAVDEAVKARISAQGSDKFDSTKYRSLLLASRDVEFVQAEVKAYEEKKREVFTPGRSVEPIAGQDDTPAPEGGLLSGVSHKSRRAR